MIVARPVLDLAIARDAQLEIADVELVLGSNLALDHDRGGGNSVPERAHELPARRRQFEMAHLAVGARADIVQLALTGFESAGHAQAALDQAGARKRDVAPDLFPEVPGTGQMSPWPAIVLRPVLEYSALT